MRDWKKLSLTSSNRRRINWCLKNGFKIEDIEELTRNHTQVCIIRMKLTLPYMTVSASSTANTYSDGDIIGWNSSFRILHEEGFAVDVPFTEMKGSFERGKSMLV